VNKFYVSRDSEETAYAEAVMISKNKPEMVDGTECKKCHDVSQGYFVAGTGYAYGVEGEVCYSAWLKLTGVKLDYGEVKHVSLEVKEIK
jgi:hypothetical protein